MAFCNSCGAVLAEGTKFCGKCGGAITGTPVVSPAAMRPAAPPPASGGGSSALKIILIVVGSFLLLGVLAVASFTFFVYRVAKNAKVTQKGDNVKVETPFFSVNANDPDITVKELGVDVYPGAKVQKAGTATATIGSIHTVTANFESSDPVGKVCDFYREKYSTAAVKTSDDTHCSIVSNDQSNSTTISAQSYGDGSRFQIVAVTKKSSN